MADYHCWPLWEAGNQLGDIDPASLTILDELRVGLLEWADEFDAIAPRRGVQPDAPGARRLGHRCRRLGLRRRGRGDPQQACWPIRSVSLLITVSKRPPP